MLTSYRYEDFCYKLFQAYNLDIIRSDGQNDLGYDFIINLESNVKYYVQVKFYKSSNVNSSIIKRAIAHIGNQRDFIGQDSKFILLIASQIDDKLKNDIYSKYCIDIIDISNQLFLVQDNEYLYKELGSILNDTYIDGGAIKPKQLEILDNLFRKLRNEI